MDGHLRLTGNLGLLDLLGSGNGDHAATKQPGKHRLGTGTEACQCRQRTTLADQTKKTPSRHNHIEAIQVIGARTAINEQAAKSAPVEVLSVFAHDDCLLGFCAVRRIPFMSLDPCSGGVDRI